MEKFDRLFKADPWTACLLSVFWGEDLSRQRCKRTEDEDWIERWLEDAVDFFCFVRIGFGWPG